MAADNFANFDFKSLINIVFLYSQKRALEAKCLDILSRSQNLKTTKFLLSTFVSL